MEWHTPRKAIAQASATEQRALNGMRPLSCPYEEARLGVMGSSVAHRCGLDCLEVDRRLSRSRKEGLREVASKPQEVTQEVAREAQGSHSMRIQPSFAQATGTALFIEVIDANVGVWGYALYVSELLGATLAFLTLPAYAGGFFDSCLHRLKLHAH